MKPGEIKVRVVVDKSINSGIEEIIKKIDDGKLSPEAAKIELAKFFNSTEIIFTRKHVLTWRVEQ